MKIIIDHLNHHYEAGTAMEVKALDNVELVIEKAQMIGLIGHTGSGKSTLVQHLNGLLKPSSGTVYIDGEDIFEKGYSLKKLRSRVGLVFQYPEHQLFDETVFKDVCFGPLNLGLSQKEAELSAYEALRMVGLGDDSILQSPFDLSGGQKRRAAIAGVLAMKPEILILDEPTAGLDPRGCREILDLLKKLQKEREITVIIVSHSMEEVAEYVDRIVVMNQGKIVFDDIPKSVFRHHEELEEMGLRAPEVVYLLEYLRNAGLPVRVDLTTVKEASDEIVKVLEEKRG